MIRSARKYPLLIRWLLNVMLLLLPGVLPVLAEEAKPADKNMETTTPETSAKMESSGQAAESQPAMEQPPAEEPAKPAVKRPKYQNLRYEEDWSVLAEGEVEGEDLWDPLKYIPLTPDGEIWLSIGGQARTRFEHFSDFEFIEGENRTDEYLWSRFFVHLDLHLTRYMRVFVEGKSAHSTDRELPGGKRSVDVDTADLHNAFIDLNLPLGEDAEFTVRAGRQELQFGKQRLVSPLDWANTRRIFEGFSAIFKYDAWKFHAFYVDTVIIDKYGWNEDSNTDKFYGLYSSGKIPFEQDLDLYFLALDRDRPITFNGTTGDEARYTVGSRVGGKLGESGFDYDLEAAYQFGSLGAFDIEAWMFASQVGYAFAAAPMKPYWFIGYDWASGDHRAGGDVETFNQLFPLGHAWNGYIDAIGRQNVADLRTGIAFNPVKMLKVALDFHQFWRTSDEDAVYNAGGAPIRGGGAATSSNVGQEIDLTLTCSLPDKHTTISAGYSHFFAGNFIDDSAPSEDIDFVYFAVQYTF